MRQIDYAAGNLRTQMRSVALNVMDRYRFSSLGEYNTLLEAFHLSAQECKGEVDGRRYEGIIYGALDEEGQRVGPPIKASSLSPHLGYSALQRRYVATKSWIEKNPRKLDTLRGVIRQAMHEARTPDVFEKNLRDAGITVVFRHSQQPGGRIFGVTFIDHHAGLVVNGSRLGKEFTANRLEAYFMEAIRHPEPGVHSLQPNNKPQKGIEKDAPYSPAVPQKQDEESENTQFFETLRSMDFMGELLDEAAQNDLWEEWQHQQQRKKKRRKTQR